MRTFCHPLIKRGLKYIFFSALLFVLSSCNKNIDDKDGNVLARVDDHYLYESDLEGIIPEKIRPRDSLILVKNYINNWIKEKVLIKKAEKNLSSEQKDFSKQLEEYRNSLIIYEYEKHLVLQELDTNILEEEIRKYYTENIDNFILPEEVYHLNYLQIPDTLSYQEEIRDLFLNDAKQMLDSLANIVAGYSSSYNLSNDTWINRSQIHYRFPGIGIGVSDPPAINQLYEIPSKRIITLVIFRDKLNAGSRAPVSYVREQIREIIINKRKAEFLKKIQRDILEEAFRSNEAEIY